MNKLNNTIVGQSEAPVYLTRKEVAQYFKVSKETIRRWENQGRITPKIVNARVYRYRLDELEKVFSL